MPCQDNYYLDFSPEFEYDIHYYLDRCAFIDQLRDLLTVPSISQLSLFNLEDYLTMRKLKRDQLDIESYIVTVGF